LAYIGSLFIAGSEEFEEKYKSGIAYGLAAKSSVDFLYEFDDSTWQVELKKDVSDIVARSTKELNKEILASDGFEIIQRALDILSVKNIFSITLDNPATRSIGVYCQNKESILFHYSLTDFPMSMNFTMTEFDSQNIEIIQPLPPEPIWNESYRYYRLSQSGNDLFEAYRNLFLGFEALINAICPKHKKERERSWLKRSLGQIDEKINLSQHSQTDSESAVDCIIRTQYKDIRCRLLHAKLPNAQLPHSRLNPVDVQTAYEQLIRIWRQIACHYFNVPNYGGLVTNIGFEKMMLKFFSNNTILSYTIDNSHLNKDDKKPSPKGDEVNIFEVTDYSGAVRPGVVRIHGYEKINSSSGKYVKPIHRICCLNNEILFSISYIESGLKISGVDGWESIQELRLVNTSQPTAEFKT